MYGGTPIKKKQHWIWPVIFWTSLIITAITSLVLYSGLKIAFSDKSVKLSAEESEKFNRVYLNADYFVRLSILYEDTVSPGIKDKSLCGAVIEKNGRQYILTAGHINQIQGKDIILKEITVFNQNFTAYPFPKARLTGYNRKMDVAVMEFSDPNYVYRGKVAKLGDSDNLVENYKVMMIGPSGLVNEGRTGKVIKEPTFWCNPDLNKDWFLLTAVAEEGFSGGPILDQDGELMGMTIQIWRNPLTGNPELSVGVKINAIKAELDALCGGARK